jgi:hypothetical protein
MGLGGPVKLGDEVVFVDGEEEHAAKVTKVHSDDCVNLIVFFDGKAPEPRTSVQRGNLSASGELRSHFRAQSVTPQRAFRTG